MFLHEFESEQKRAFVGLAHRVIHADDAHAVEEAEMMDLVRREMDMETIPPAGEGATVSELTRPFVHQKDRVAVVLELLLISHADGEVHPAEERVIGEVAEAFGLGNEDLETCRSWALRQVALGQEAVALRADVRTAA